MASLSIFSAKCWDEKGLSQMQTFLDSFQSFLSPYFRENAPGQQECDKSAESVEQSINKIDAAYLSAISQNLEPSTVGTLKVIIIDNVIPLINIRAHQKGLLK